MTYIVEYSADEFGDIQDLDLEDVVAAFEAAVNEKLEGFEVELVPHGYANPTKTPTLRLADDDLYEEYSRVSSEVFNQGDFWPSQDA